jgi:3-oxoacyl-[acyl-carrier protein] reductase
MSTRNALVIGSSGTLGGAIARELLARGFGVGLHYNTRREATEALSGEAQARALPAKIDALVWAAGIVRDAPVLTLKEDDLRAVLKVDLTALFLLLKATSRQFMKQKAGSIIALSSHAARAGRLGGAAYAMAHSGMLALVKSTAREWGGLGVRINAVLPPFVADSAMGRQATPEFAAAAKARRALKPDTDGAQSVAQFVAALIENPATSGQVLSVDSRIV